MAEKAKSNKPSNLTEWDKKFGWSQILSVISMLVSITMALIGFLYFSPKLDQQKNELAELRDTLKMRPELVVTDINNFTVTGGEYLQFKVTNTGKYPAKELQLVIWTTTPETFSAVDNVNDVIRKHILIEPPIKFNPEFENGVTPIIRLSLDGQLPPGQTLFVKLFETPKSVYIRNQYGDMIVIFQSEGPGGSL